MPIFAQNDISENVFGWSYSELNDKFEYLNSLKFFDVIKAHKRNSIAEMMSREDKKVFLKEYLFVYFFFSDSIY